jgi:hypothetical protein
MIQLTAVILTIILLMVMTQISTAERRVCSCTMLGE